MKIRTHADIEKLEQVPVTARIRHASVADLLRDATRENAGRVAIRYLAGTGPADPVRDVTFEQLMRHVFQAANLLNAHGIGPHDTVTLLMPSVPETFFALWGAEIAAVANPVNYF
ncbi:MAG TPA: AMP-binding protein, partial [Reyranella sp.]